MTAMTDTQPTEQSVQIKCDDAIGRALELRDVIQGCSKSMRFEPDALSHEEEKEKKNPTALPESVDYKLKRLNMVLASCLNSVNELGRKIG